VDAPEGQSSETARPDRPKRRRKGSTRRPAKCTVCAAPLDTAAARTLGRCEACPSSADPALVEALREWRTRRAATDKVPPYVVLTDVTLLALAEQLPRTEEGLLQIPGIAERKVESYGADILTVLQADR